MESLNAHTTSNALFFRFHIIEPLADDLVNVRVISPSAKVIKTYPDTQNDHDHIPVRENGLFSFCFQRHTYAPSKKLSVYFQLEFLSVGSRTLTTYPTVSATATASNPDTTMSASMDLVPDQSVGLLHFALDDLSTSLIHAQTRVMLLLSAEYVATSSISEDLSVEIHAIDPVLFPQRGNASPTWTALTQHRVLSTLASSRPVSNVGTISTGTAIEFDVTDALTDALERHDPAMAFVVFTKEVSSIKITTLAHTSADLWPQLVVEEMGDDTMLELSVFRETLLSLRGDLTYIIQRERVSRDLAETTNSRVKWMSLLLNVVLVGIGAGQILAIRMILQTSY